MFFSREAKNKTKLVRNIFFERKKSVFRDQSSSSNYSWKELELVGLLNQSNGQTKGSILGLRRTDASEAGIRRAEMCWFLNRRPGKT